MNGKKSLKDISWLVEENEYRTDPAYSYSTIAKFDREGFEKLDSLFDKVESPSLLFGSCVDTLLTDGQDAFDKLFFVADFPEIQDNVKKIVESLFDLYSDKYEDLNLIPDKYIIPITETYEYQKNWKPETRAKVIKEKGAEYYNLKYLAGDKTIITSTLYTDVTDCVSMLKTSDATKWYFQDDDPFDNSIERLYQLKFKGEYEGINLRGMMDLVVVDHKNKIIYPCDLKTSYKAEWNFYKSFVEWRYFIQSSLYYELLKQNIEKDEYFKDFKIADYRFIVICNKTRQPLVWEWNKTKTDIDIAINGVNFPNWRGIVKKLDYYLKNRPNVPDNISIDKPNSLTDFIFKYGSN